MRVTVVSKTDTFALALSFLAVSAAFTIGAYRDFRDNGFKLAGILPSQEIRLRERRLEIGNAEMREAKQKPLIPEIRLLGYERIPVKDLKMADYGPDGVAW